MKFSTVAIIAILGAIAYLLFGPTTAQKRPATEERPSRVIPASQASQSPQSARTVQPPAVPAVPAGMGPMAPVSLKPVTKEQLVIVRGIVLSIAPDGLLIDCNQPRAGAGNAIPANAGAADMARLAEMASLEESKQWGDLMIADGTSLSPASWNPRETVTGTIVLKDHPGQSRVSIGSHVKIVAAPLGEIRIPGQSTLFVYSASFTFAAQPEDAPPPPKNWMWDPHRGTMMNH